jgi:tRNA1(Val) A37 N6-methylase TrmN6
MMGTKQIIGMIVCLISGSRAIFPESSVQIGSNNMKLACYPFCDLEENSRQSNEYIWRQFGNAHIAHLPELDGGGSNFGMDTVRYIHNRFGRDIPRCVEMCAGAGLIGFSLYEIGICKTLVLIDVNPVAIQTMRKTLEENPSMEGKVFIYQSNVLSDIPVSEYGTWDVVFANPPHYHQSSLRPMETMEHGRAIDTDWMLHRQFYASVHRFLNPQVGHVLFVESRLGSSVTDFYPMLHQSGLVLASVHDAGILSYECGSSSIEMWYMHTTNNEEWWKQSKESLRNPCLITIECLGFTENGLFDISMEISQPNQPPNPTCEIPLYENGALLSHFYAR